MSSSSTENMRKVSTWQVTAQQQTQQAMAGRGFVAGVLVSFTTGMGNGSSVFVPDDQYNPDSVRTLIAAKANLVDAVGKLSG